jgi:hypothetical protein
MSLQTLASPEFKWTLVSIPDFFRDHCSRTLKFALPPPQTENPSESTAAIGGDG